MIRRPIAIGGILLAAWTVARLALIPADPALTNEFTHDSGYIGIVARNLAAGNGYVNDAYWLLFLNPDSLPMPFHNANPLYPTLIAAIMWLTGVDAAKAGALISAVCSPVLAVAVFLLIRRFTPDFRFALVGAAAAVVWPGSFRDSFSVVPDALCTSLAFSAFAALVRSRAAWQFAATGILFGLAWLTRSSALLILPGMLAWIFLHNKTAWIRPSATLLAAAALTASPWLVRTVEVRGSPFASDNSYYWLQEYHAQVGNRDLGQYWRSLDEPRSFSQILREEPVRFAAFVLKGLPRFAYTFLTGIADWSKPAAAAFLIAVLLSVWWVPWRITSIPPAATVLLSTLALTVRPGSFEARYWSISSLLVLLWALWSFKVAAVPLWTRTLLGLCLLFFTLVQDINTIRKWLPLDPQRVAYREQVQSFQTDLSPGESVITDEPYLFTYFTGRSAISPPFVPPARLAPFMAKYHARFLLLPADRLEYFYPGAPQTLPPTVRLRLL